MATGKPPWYYKTNPIAVLMHVCTTNTLPELPTELSDVAKDFIICCFKRNPSERPNVYKLLRHPFVYGETPIAHLISYKQAEEVFMSTSTKFASEPMNDKNIYLSGSLAESTLQDQVNLEEEEEEKEVLDQVLTDRLSDEISDYNLDPSHNVKAPFENILTITKFIAAPEGREEEIILRRPSSSSDSLEIENCLSRSISSESKKCNRTSKIKLQFHVKEVDV